MKTAAPILAAAAGLALLAPSEARNAQKGGLRDNSEFMRELAGSMSLSLSMAGLVTASAKSYKSEKSPHSKSGKGSRDLSPKEECENLTYEVPLPDGFTGYCVSAWVGNDQFDRRLHREEGGGDRKARKLGYGAKSGKSSKAVDLDALEDECEAHSYTDCEFAWTTNDQFD